MILQFPLLSHLSGQSLRCITSKPRISLPRVALAYRQVRIRSLAFSKVCSSFLPDYPHPAIKSAGMCILITAPCGQSTEPIRENDHQDLRLPEEAITNLVSCIDSNAYAFGNRRCSPRCTALSIQHPAHTSTRQECQICSAAASELGLRQSGGKVIVTRYCRLWTAASSLQAMLTAPRSQTSE